MRIGQYELGADIAGFPDSREFSASEYTLLTKSFERERIFRAPDVMFLGFTWNIVLGAIDRSIYKISAQAIPEAGQGTRLLFSATLGHLSAELGAPSEEAGHTVIWDTGFGNVMVERVEVGGFTAVNIHITSGSLVRASKPIDSGSESVTAETRADAPWLSRSAAHVVTQLFVVVVLFAISRIVGTFVLFLLIGGAGKKWFQGNAYFYSRWTAVVNGLVWGFALGVLFCVAVDLLHPALWVAVSLLVWGFLAAGYSGYGDGPAPSYVRDGSHANLSLIRLSASVVFLFVAVASLSLMRW